MGGLEGRVAGPERRGTYGVASCELLFCADDRAAALRGVERALASHDCLSSCAATAGLAADLRDGIPVFRHDECLQRVWMDE